MGVLPHPEDKIKEKWRLEPGKMLLIDLEKGSIISDKELKDELSNKFPYISILKESNILIGNGFEETEELLLNKYKSISPKKKSDWFIQKKFNTHNQYLDILLSQGYIGLVIFTIFLCIIFRNSIGTNRFSFK